MANYAQTLLDPFAGEPQTPQAAKSQREYAAMLTQQSQRPVAHWAQGLGNVVNALLGGYTEYKAGEAERMGSQRAMADFLASLNPQGPPQTPNTPQAPQQPPKFNFAPPPGPQFADIPGMTVAPQAPQNSVTQNIIRAESGGNPNAVNPNSSATGAGQFINSTWLDMVRKNRPDLAANKTDQEILALRSDPQLSSEMTTAYANQNNQLLTQRGIPVNPQNTYLAHFAGPKGAVDILTANPNTPVSQILSPQAVQANPFLQNMTAQDLQNWAQDKMTPKGSQGLAPPVNPSAANASAGVPLPPPSTQQATAPSINREMLAQVLTNPWSSPQLQQAALQRFMPKPPITVKQGETLLNPETLQPVFQAKEKPELMEVDAGTKRLIIDKSTNQIVREIPKDIAGVKGAEIQGERQANARVELPKAIDVTQSTLGLIDQIRNHPGRSQVTEWKGKLPPIPGSQGQDFVALLEQVKGRSFLEAFNSLKGGGQITEREGQAATQAINRLEQAQTKAGFDAALNDLQKILRQGLKRQYEAAGEKAPDDLTKSLEPQMRTYNPATGRLE